MILYSSIRKFWKSIWGGPCESGLKHRLPPFRLFREHKYCQHPDCVVLRSIENLPAIATFQLDGVSIQAPAETIDKIREMQAELLTQLLEVQRLKTYCNKAFEEGRQKGIQMERQRIYATLLQSRQLLLDSLTPIGITEHRTKQFVEWYETQRDARYNPMRDTETYNICKNILALEEILTSMQTGN